MLTWCVWSQVGVWDTQGSHCLSSFVCTWYSQSCTFWHWGDRSAVSLGAVQCDQASAASPMIAALTVWFPSGTPQLSLVISMCDADFQAGWIWGFLWVPWFPSFHVRKLSWLIYRYTYFQNFGILDVLDCYNVQTDEPERAPALGEFLVLLWLVCKFSCALI